MTRLDRARLRHWQRVVFSKRHRNVLAQVKRSMRQGPFREYCLTMSIWEATNEVMDAMAKTKEAPQ